MSILRVLSKKLYYSGKKASRMLFPVKIGAEKFFDYQPCSDFFLQNIKVLDSLPNDIKKSIIRDADKTCNHIFSFLGLENQQLGDKIIWSCDYKSQYVWANRYYKEIGLKIGKSSSDIKMPWELSRFQHLILLGQAYTISGADKYALEFVNEIKDWTENNKYEFSVNWTCAMEVSIRAVNWIVAHEYFIGSELIDREFWANYYALLYAHGKFIFSNLEYKKEGRSNHYIADLVGLVYLGLFLKGNNDAGAWFEYGVTQLEKEIIVQTNPDGTDYEASTYYHCFVTEMLLYTVILMKKHNLGFSTAFMTRLEKMCEYVKDILKPNGNIPLIGDNDDSKFIRFSSSLPINDYRELLSLAGIVFCREDFLELYDDKIHHAILNLYGIRKADTCKRMIQVSKLYRDSGICVIHTDQVYFITHYGNVGKNGLGGHGHNDILGFELNVCGVDIFVDPGTYTYTSDYELRNKFRSTSMHNVLSINDIEQNDIVLNKLFTMIDRSRGELVRYEESEDKHVLEAKHFGFAHLGIVHRRVFCLDFGNEVIQIIDYLDRDNHYSPKVKWFFNLHPDVSINEIQDDKVVLKRGNIHISLAYDASLRFSDLSSSYSKGYGELSKNRVLLFENDLSCPIKECYEFAVVYYIKE